MVRGKGLAENTGIQLIHRFIGKAAEAFITFCVAGTGNFNVLVYLFPIGNQSNFHAVNDGGELILKFGNQNFTIVLQPETFSNCILRNAQPADVTLGHVPQPFAIVDEVMNPSLQHSFKIYLHFPAIDFNHDA